MNTTTRRIDTQRAEDLHRLADQGERNGCRILVEPISGAHFATSATSPILYRVSVDGGCTCRGYQVWRRCQHHSLLLSELGAIPDPESVVSDVVILDEQPASCRTCRGTGFLRMTTGPALSDWVMAPCTNCPGHQAAPTAGSSRAAAHAA